MYSFYIFRIYFPVLNLYQSLPYTLTSLTCHFVSFNIFFCLAILQATCFTSLLFPSQCFLLGLCLRLLPCCCYRFAFSRQYPYQPRSILFLFLHIPASLISRYRVCLHWSTRYRGRLTSFNTEFLLCEIKSVFEVATGYDDDSSGMLCRENLKSHLATEYVIKISTIVTKADVLTFKGYDV